MRTQICHESGGRIGKSNETWVNLSYIGDVQQLVENDFKGIKIDKQAASTPPPQLDFHGCVW